MKKILVALLNFLLLGQAYAQWQGTNPVYFNAGNVGIGTINPVVKLQVDMNNPETNYSNLPSTVFLRNTSAQSNNLNGISFGDASGWGVAGIVAQLKNIGSHTASLMTLHENSNVGIGTTAPESKLDVNGDIRISSATLPMGLITESGGTSPILNLNINFRGPGLVQANRGGSFRIDSRDNFHLFQWLYRAPGTAPGTGETLLMNLTQDGKLGIGTSSPDAKLAVKGTIHSKEVKVDMLGAMVPDYVFANNYQLLTINELKTYIDQNKHLPEVPSAKEMEVNGINLGEMNMLLLKKVEELTLYQIEAMKRIEKLEAELKSKK